MSIATTCINGTFVPASAAAIPVSDRLVRFGDGVFETIRIESGVPYQWELHLERLMAGLVALRIIPPAADWKLAVKTMLRQNAIQDGFLRIAVSRGIGSRGYVPDEKIQANWIIESLPPAITPTAPVRLFVSGITRPPLSSLPVNAKLAHGIGSTLALLEARDHGCEDAILLTVDGKLCETASANLFWIAGGEFYTPSLETGCLAGTTRAAVLRLAPVKEVIADLGALHNADALFLTNTRLGVWPATCAKFKIQDSSAHYMLGDLMNALAADHAHYIEAHRSTWDLA